MKEKIHPKYYEAKVTCSCGNTWTVGSTKKEINIEVCSACHPVFTGTSKQVAATGRVEKFLKKYGMLNKESTATKTEPEKKDTAKE